MTSRQSARRRVVVVGSGAAGLAAAMAAASAEAAVTVVEAADLLGGTTATSAGGIWLPANPWAAARGMQDSPEEALRYLGRLDLGDSNSRLASTFLLEGPRVIRALEDLSALSWDAQLGWPDYHMEFEGAKRGRGLDFGPLRLRREILACVRPDPYERSEPVRGQVDVAVQNAELVTGGRALVGALLTTLTELGVEVLTGVRATGLVTSGDAVVGIDASREVIEGEVVIASGGFERNPSLVRAFLRGPVTAPAGPPTNRGDGLTMGMSVGAALGNMSEAWWCPALAVPGETIDGAPFFRMLFVDLATPGGVIVGRDGRRFVSEATNYNDLGRTLHAFDTERYAYPRSPSWFVFDSERRGQPLGPLGASAPDPEWLPRADSISELADRVGISPAQLSETVARFNDQAVLGTDPDYRRGDYQYDHFSAGTTSLRPVNEPPFYALRILAGCLGTKGGLRTDEHGRVLRADSARAIPGLRAAGNASANFLGGAYPGPGSTLGSALVFGWLAGEGAASAP
jgi:3-oxosteroid 1-dehydrogenase